MDIYNMGFDINEYEIIKKIGNGQFGEVYLYTKKTDGHQYALKIFNTELIKDVSQEKILREFIIMKQLNYPTVLKCYGINLQNNENKTSILTEYMPNGSLKSKLNNVEFLTPTKKYKMIIGIAYGMKYLHNHKFIHRDLKLENILLNEQFEPCICDFGSSRFYDKFQSKDIDMTLENIFTPLYMAPELIEFDIPYYNEKVDVYSFSIIVYQIITNKLSFKIFDMPEYNPYIIWNKVVKGERPDLNIDTISDKMRDLLNQCWDKVSKNRLSFDSICNLLSNDFSYIKEEIDEQEIKNYISILQEAEKQDQNYFYNESYFKFLDIVFSKMDKFNEIKTKNIYNLFFFFGNFLLEACKLGNKDIVQYLISCKKFDIQSKTIYSFLFLKF